MKKKKNILVVTLISILCSNQIIKSMENSPKILEKSAQQALDTYLFNSSAQGNYNSVKNAITEGANVNYANETTGATPLHNAVLKNHFNIINLLITNGANINAKDLFDVTPLIKSASTGNLEMVQFLLKQGADINAKAELGSNKIDAIEIAINNNHHNVATFLKEFKKTRAKKVSETTFIIPDLVDIIEEYEGYKDSKKEVKCEAE